MKEPKRISEIIESMDIFAKEPKVVIKIYPKKSRKSRQRLTA